MTSNITVAFDILLEEIENAIDELTQEGTHAFQTKDLTTAGRLAEKGKQFTEFRQEIVDLQEKWNSIVSGVNIREQQPVTSRYAGETKIKRLKHGLRTPQPSYYEPILQSLTTLGGKGSAKEVIKLVGRSMKAVLNKDDRELLSSGNTTRWEKTANWARMDMVKQRLLSPDSEHGVWEITDKGVKWLAERTGSPRACAPKEDTAPADTTDDPHDDIPF